MTRFSSNNHETNSTPQYKKIPEALDGRDARICLANGVLLTGRVYATSSYGVLVDVGATRAFFPWHIVDKVEVSA
jgi:hypothetical protein